MIEMLVFLLNEAARLDPFAIQLLVQHRQACNDALDNHPRIITGTGDGVFRASIGMIGLINGLEPDKKRIVPVIDPEGLKPIRFEVGTPVTHPKLFGSKHAD